MSVSKKEVERIAALARLDVLDEDEPAEEGRLSATRLTEELNRILEHVATLEEADISEIEEPIRLPLEAVPFRDPGLQPDNLQEGAPADQAPQWREGFFVVPRLPALVDDEAGGL